MNKKGIIAIVVIIILIIVGYMAFGRRNDQGAPYAMPSATSTGTTGSTTNVTASLTNQGTTDATLLGRLDNASVAASETGNRVALVNGSAKFTSDDGSSGTVALGKIAIESGVSGANYALVPLTVTASGHASNAYLVLFKDSGSSLVDDSYAYLGSGVTVTGIRADNTSGGLAVTVTYTDSTGATKTKILVVSNGAFDASKEIDL